MALKFTDKVTTIASASLGSPSSGTLGFWLRRPSTSLSDQPAIARFGTSTGKTLEYDYSPVQTIKLAAGYDNAFDPSVGSWVYLAIVKSGNNIAVYGFTDTSAETRTNMKSSYYAPTTLTTVEFGDVTAAYGVGYQDAEYLDIRVWNSALTTAQLNTEKNSATAVITSGLLLAASCETALTAQTGTDLSVVSGTGYTFSSPTGPTARSGGASVAPLVTLATRSPAPFTINY